MADEFYYTPINSEDYPDWEAIKGSFRKHVEKTKSSYGLQDKK